MAATAATMLMTTMAATQSVQADNIDNEQNVYTVQTGDTLSEIAQAHNTTASELAQNSGIQNIDLIYVGDKIKFSADNQRVESITTPDGEVKKPEATFKPNPTVNPAEISTSNYYQAEPAKYEPVMTTGTNATTTSYQGQSSSAKDYIANKESGGSYDVRNGDYVGKYQLSSSYLNGDYSAENQERVADQYVQSRYGSWEAAASHSQQYGWY